MGRAAIFLICFVIWVNSFFLIVIFVNIFSQTATSVVTTLIGCSGDSCGFWGERRWYAIIIAVLLLPTIFMKEIAELHLVSMSLFGAALVFVVINILQVLIRKTHFVTNFDISYDYAWPKLGSSKDATDFLNAIAIIFTASNFQVNLFPIHSNQVDKSIGGSTKIYTVTMFLVQAIYMLLSVCVIFNYGSLLSDDVLANIGRKYPANCV